MWTTGIIRCIRYRATCLRSFVDFLPAIVSLIMHVHNRKTTAGKNSTNDWRYIGIIYHSCENVLRKCGYIILRAFFLSSHDLTDRSVPISGHVNLMTKKGQKNALFISVAFGDRLMKGWCACTCTNRITCVLQTVGCQLYRYIITVGQPSQYIS